MATSNRQAKRSSKNITESKNNKVLKKDVNEFISTYFEDKSRSANSTDPAFVIEEESDNSIRLLDEIDEIDEICPNTNIPFQNDCPIPPEIEAETSNISQGEERHDMNIRQQIVAWTIECNIPQSSVNKLLKILQPVIPNLPSDVRTLKQTPRNIPITQMEGGKYIHYGIKDSLSDLLSQTNFREDYLELNFNIDGLPVSKSSGAQVWPILMNVAKTEVVLLVGVFEGYSKPKHMSGFLKNFVEELKQLQEDGFQYCGQYFVIKIGYFVCDAPARAMVLGIKSHTGFYSCHKCIQRGMWVQHKIIFQLSENEVRTNEGYRCRKYPEHHTQQEQNVLELLEIDMVKQFPMDYMHVVCLGVMKALIKAWCKHRKKPYSISSSKLKVLNSRLIGVKTDVPREFCRKPRTTAEIDRWKATELRMFLLYTGPIVLQNILDSDRYNHFLTLSAAIQILLSDNSDNIDDADQLLSDFVAKIPVLYNELFLTYNIHCLTHLSTDVKNIGSLNKFDAFKFENFLQQIKRKLKQKKFFCNQIYKRIVEASLNHENINLKDQIHVGEFKEGSYVFYQTNKYFFSLKHPDNFYIYNKKVYMINSIKKVSGKYIVHGYPIVTRNLFPHHLKIMTSSSIRFEGGLQEHVANDIRKIFKLKIGKKLYFLPLIH